MRPILIAALVLVAAACETSRSPSPVGASTISTATPSPTAPPLSDVSGAWTGTISYVYEDDWCACCIPASQASATFTQNGAQVSGVIHSACFDEEFTGTLQAGQLSGTAKVNAWNVVYNGQAAGTATTERFSLATKNLERDGGYQVSGYTIKFSR